MNTTIPKTIHYCWFSDDPYPPLVARCLESWKQHLPGWNIVHWKKIPDALPYAQELLAQKRYAFASDYVRFYAIHTQGGIYLDADIEVVRPLDPLLSNQQFIGYEEEGRLNSSVCGGMAGGEFFKACLDAMDNHYRHSKLPLLSPELCTQVAKTRSFPGLTLYPPHVFYPYNPYDKARPIEQLMYADIKPDTYTIHHWAKTWKYSLPERARRLVAKLREQFAK
jgi:hypothetical protein